MHQNVDFFFLSDVFICFIWTFRSSDGLFVFTDIYLDLVLRVALKKQTNANEILAFGGHENILNSCLMNSERLCIKMSVIPEYLREYFY